ncbi:MAG: hypothetical protein IJP82_05945 [Bacteroidaceae bacterium]|nr:hypothetical protein [Bacteroidaceae bacterium]
MKKILFPLSLLLLTACNGTAPKAGQDAAEKADSTMTALANFDEAEASDETEAQGLSDYEEDLMDIDQMPKTAERMDSHFQTAVYVNVEQQPTEDEPEGIYSVWLADERAGTVRKICQTNPTANAQWEKMDKKNSDAVDVPMQLIAVAEKAYLAPGDVSKVIVEGCPDGRNIWTYIIDTSTHTAKQLPSTEGVVDLDWQQKEIILASYGYYPAPDYGRYTQKKAYSLDGKFIRMIGEPEPE